MSIEYVRKVDCMSKIITTDNGQRYSTPGGWTTTGAVIAGSAVSSMIGGGVAHIVNSPLVNGISPISQSCDNKVLRKGILDAFQKSGLAKNGVEIIDVKQSQKFAGIKPNGNLSEISSLNAQLDAYIKSLQKPNKRLYDIFLTSIPDFLRKTPIGKAYALIMLKMIEDGKNAGYITNTKNIAINIDKLGTAIFHEMGHAINHNQSKIWKAIQGMRFPCMAAAGIFSTTALLKRKKLEGEQPANNFDKVTTFVKDNVGKLVLASFVPIISEELMATHRGNNLAQKVLPLDMLKKVKKTNRLGALSYISTALLSACAAVAASKTRDAIAEPKPVN